MSWIFWVHLSLMISKCFCFTQFKQMLKDFYKLNICVPSKFTCWNPIPQCDGIKRWTFTRKSSGLDEMMMARSSWMALVVKQWQDKNWNKKTVFTSWCVKCLLMSPVKLKGAIRLIIFICFLLDYWPDEIKLRIIFTLSKDIK